jgi:hypothetical protein
MNDAAGLGQETGAAPPGAMAASTATGHPTPREPAAAGDALREAMAFVSAATEAGITVRLLGGIAVRILCPDYPPRPVAGVQDIDLATVTPARKALQTFLIDQGHQPDKTFNALYGHKQLYFTSAASGRPIDVLVDRLAMCHELDFRDRITKMPYTLDLVDMLLSKLQIVRLNEKDARDIIYLLSAHPVQHEAPPGSISLEAFRAIVANDWGWWRTATLNLTKIQALIRQETDRLVPANPQHDPAAQASTLITAANEVPKSKRWKLRARIGDRVRWYQEPDESTHH